MSAHRRALLTGIGVALAVAIPPTLVVQILDAGYTDVSGAVTFPVAVLVVAGMALGGYTAASQAPDRQVPVAALAGLVATVMVQGLGILRRSAADDDVAWATVPAVAALSVLAAAIAGGLAGRRAASTRP
jgi:hypothetical protein